MEKMMSKIQLRPYQIDAIDNMKNGCILCGGVGSGKSLTSLSYYYKEQGGRLNKSEFTKMKKPKDLIIITTARKRDTLEWDEELIPFLLNRDPSLNLYKNKVFIDSWNNIKKYSDTKDSFFIFDEQRLVGYGAWVQAFLKIAKNNDWILLSATPGDVWLDYLPVFIANGFFKNKKEFIDNHVIYSRFSKFPKIDRYINTGRLLKYRKSLLVDMDFKRETESIHKTIYVDYDKDLYKKIGKDRWNPYTDEPIINAAELCYTWRKVVNGNIDRVPVLQNIAKNHKRIIVFYNFNYELEILRGVNYGENVTIAEWNGHKHEAVPSSDKWVYLVQYTSGCEGWNCITTDTIVFYSPNYSYKVMTQAAGRTDRMNTPYKQLYYYHITTKSNIDLAISKALKEKRNFNATSYGGKIIK